MPDPDDESDEKDYPLGPYTGYGPKNYHRSDQNILEDINDRLTDYGQLDARDIHVDVNQGEVTLSGTVNSRRGKRIAEDIADSVSGVVDVHNQLRIQSKENQSQIEDDCANKDNLRRGMEVVGVHGRHLGYITEVGEDGFWVVANGGKQIYLPFSSCKSVNGRLQLKITIDEAAKMGWRRSGPGEKEE